MHFPHSQIESKFPIEIAPYVHSNWIGLQVDANTENHINQWCNFISSIWIRWNRITQRGSEWDRTHDNASKNWMEFKFNLYGTTSIDCVMRCIKHTNMDTSSTACWSSHQMQRSVLNSIDFFHVLKNLNFLVSFNAWKRMMRMCSVACDENNGQS